MKKSTIKLIGLFLIALNSLVFFCEMRNVKIIIDETAPMGIELDFTEAQLSLKNQAQQGSIGDEVAMP